MRAFAGIGTALVTASLAVTAPAQDLAEQQAEMVQAIERHAESAPGAIEGGQIDPEILQVMRVTPRHEFIPEEQRHLAYEDRPVPIGYGQTISQPFIVALMTDLLEVEPGDTVLEIGTGSGYQAAVLAPLVDEVYSIEIVPELGERAARVLDEQGYDNVETKIADGYYGWPEAAPFDAIVVTAAASHIPPPLVEQLEVGGRMVIPIGGPFAAQQLMLVEKQPDGSVTSQQLLPVQFVPFTRAEGQ